LSSKLRIAVLGTGAVGGYFGGLLARQYRSSEETEIIFITRPATEKIIREKGLKIITPKEEFNVSPAIVTSQPQHLGIVDLLICSVKSYDLEESISSAAACIGPDTVVLPLLNGVDSVGRIHSLLPGTEVWEGCVYIVARLSEPGIITETGNIHSLYFGSPIAKNEKLLLFETIFKTAGIDCHLVNNIEQVTWEKFMFISPLASLTSYLDLPVGAILENSAHLKMLKELQQELLSVARAKNIALSPGLAEASIAKMQKLPYETTSSMHSDFKKGGKTEYQSLVQFVLDTGKEMNLHLPVYAKILQGLTKE